MTKFSLSVFLRTKVNFLKLIFVLIDVKKLPAICASTELQVGLLSVLHQWKPWAFYTRI
jgi:hypothetical protein